MNPVLQHLLQISTKVYIQHQPLITKGFLTCIIRGKQRPDFSYFRPQVEATEKVIVLVIGGITYMKKAVLWQCSIEKMDQMWFYRY